MHSHTHTGIHTHTHTDMHAHTHKHNALTVTYTAHMGTHMRHTKCAQTHRLSQVMVT